MTYYNFRVYDFILKIQVTNVAFLVYLHNSTTCSTINGCQNSPFTVIISNTNCPTSLPIILHELDLPFMLNCMIFYNFNKMIFVQKYHTFFQIKLPYIVIKIILNRLLPPCMFNFTPLLITSLITTLICGVKLLS